MSKHLICPFPVVRKLSGFRGIQSLSHLAVDEMVVRSVVVPQSVHISEDLDILVRASGKKFEKTGLSSTVNFVLSHCIHVMDVFPGKVSSCELNNHVDPTFDVVFPTKLPIQVTGDGGITNGSSESSRDTGFPDDSLIVRELAAHSKV